MGIRTHRYLDWRMTAILIMITQHGANSQNISWQAQDSGIHAPQFHGLQHQSYDHAYSFQSAPQQQYQAKPPPPEVSEELLETIRVLIKNTEQMT